jgi:Tfp pilus assembly protein PilF
LSKDPLRPDVWRLLAAQLAQAGDFAGVGMAQAAELRASVHHPRLQQAAQALVANDIPIAERLLKAHLREDDRDIAALRMLAEVAGRIGRYDDARTLLEHALEIAPRSLQRASTLRLSTIASSVSRRRWSRSNVCWKPSRGTPPTATSRPPR